VCYDGAAFRRVLAMRSSPEQRARAALALTQPECIGGALGPAERRRLDEWRAGVLDRVDEAALAAHVKNRVLLRRAGVWSSLAYQRARQDEAPGPAAARALQALAAIDRNELAEEDAASYKEAALRVSASRWGAAVPPSAAPDKGPHIVTVPRDSGETCVLLVDAKSGTAKPLAKRCTYALVWTASATLNREATALALAVQPTEAWRELWIFHKTAKGWTVRVLPPASMTPGIGYAELAGWPPGGRQVLVAREALGEGRRTREFELLRLDTLARVAHAAEPGALAALRRWQDPAWKRDTLSLR